MKTILIPTDLSTESISLVHKALQHVPDAPVQIVLLHLVRSAPDIGELLRSSRHKFYSQLPQGFCEAVQVLKKRYAEKAQLRFEICFCNTSRVFKNILDAYHINEIYLLNNYTYKMPFKESVHIEKYVSDSKLPVFKINRPKQLQVSKDTNLLSSLLLMPEFRRDRAYAKEETL